MNNSGLTPIDCKKQIFHMVDLVFSGLSEKEKGKFIASDGRSEFLEDDVYKAIYQLSKEFPDFFPGYFVKMMGDFPHCAVLEDILFDLRAFELIRYGYRDRKNVIFIEPIVKNTMAINLQDEYDRKQLREYLPVVQRFNELISQKVAP